MTDQERLLILKLDLQLTHSRLDGYLSHLLSSASQMIQAEGITLEDTALDDQLQVMYAAYIYRKRDKGEAMPRMLRFALNNRVLQEAEKTDVAGQRNPDAL